MPDPVSRLLQRASWQAEKLFKARGWLRTMVWCTKSADGRRQVFETACEVERTEISDAQALAALCAELRADFAADGVVRYAVAFPASATTLLRPSALHLDIERRAHEVIALEAHAADAHLRAHRAIVLVGGVARLAALGPIELAPVARFGSLITK
jgi:hypothetical protein